MTRSLFSLRRAAILSSTLALGVVMAACGGTPAASSAAAEPSSSAPAGSDGAETGANVITAADMAFDTDTLTVSSGDATITFTNNDTVPHNFSVYTEEGGDVLVTGDIINQGETDEITLSGLAPGEYYFHCDLHPDMNGTLVVEG